MHERAIHRHSGMVAVFALVVTFGGVAIGVALEGQVPGSAIGASDLALTAAFLALPAAGAVLVWRRPGNAVGWLLAGAGAFGGVYVVAHGWAVYALRIRSPALPGGEVAAWIVTWGLVPTLGVLPYVAATFPTGRIDRRRLRQFGRVAVVAMGALALAQAFAPDHLDGVASAIRPIPNPAGVAALQGATSALTSVAVLIVVAFTLAAMGDAMVRYRRSAGDERRQLRAVALFPALIPAAIALSFVVPDAAVDPLIVGSQALSLVGLSVTLIVAVLRYRLYDLGDFLRRTAAYVALSGAVVVAVLAVAALVGVLAPSDGSVPTAVAAGAVALALGPLRTRLQGGIDRLLFGRRNEPYAVLAEIGARVEASADPTAALNEIVESVAASLRVPAVVIERDGAASVGHGVATGLSTRLDLVHQNQRVGTLVIGHRSSDEAFTDRELQLLRDLARQVAVAVHAASTTAALQKARLELVSGREDERRRLRRDIHDGIGPTLAGTMLQLDTLSSLINGHSDEAQVLAAKVKANLARLVEDVRRVSHDLRPPTLDELGLVGALRERVDSLTRGAGITVELDLPATTRSLTAAVEVAIYRIASEALTNVVRHSNAGSCSIRLSIGERVELEVCDDGCGLLDGLTPGIGLVSMRERAAEVGGVCTIDAARPTGARVRAVLPVMA